MRRFKKTTKVFLTVTYSLFLSGNMFICFMSGPDPDTGMKYLVSAAGLSILMPATICLLGWRVLHLEKRIEELEKKTK